MEEVKRKLASIRRIAEIRPIEGADSIELAIVDGWQCVVKKGEFKAGDLCVYFEIDSFLPIRPKFEFLRKSSYKKMGDKEGFRLRTIKLKGQISQGLVMRPIDLTEPYLLYTTTDSDKVNASEPKRLTHNDLFIGTDVTEKFDVVKYEAPIPACMQGKIKGNFPSFIRKTDLERVQNIWDKVKDDDQVYEVTIKLDGTSATYYMKDGKFGVCSRNLDLEEDENNVYWKMAKKYDIENILRSLGRNLAFQGEIIGEGIQDNHEGISGQEFYLFDVWDIDAHRYLIPVEKYNLLQVYVSGYKHQDDYYIPTHPFPLCPIIISHKDITHTDAGFLSFKRFNKDINKLLEYANGPSLHADVREGIVFKACVSDQRFKVISNEYLLKEK
jgi:RNA ligase (TIGR02306 family)